MGREKNKRQVEKDTKIRSLMMSHKRMSQNKIKWLSEEMIEVQNAMWNVWIKNFVFELWNEQIKLN